MGCGNTVQSTLTRNDGRSRSGEEEDIEEMLPRRVADCIQLSASSARYERGRTRAGEYGE